MHRHKSWMFVLLPILTGAITPDHGLKPDAGIFTDLNIVIVTKWQ